MTSAKQYKEYRVRLGMDYKQETVRAYNQYTSHFSEKYARHFEQHVRPDADLFITHLPARAKLLDLGSGPGHHAAYFQHHGLDVICIDLSERMAAACREKGLHAIVMDIENLLLPEGMFDGIWAYASLLHIPKQNLPRVITKLTRLLKPSGMLGLAVKQGEGERFETREEFPGTQRWFSYYGDDEIRNLFHKFDVLHFGTTSSGKKTTFLHYLMKRKNQSTV